MNNVTKYVGEEDLPVMNGARYSAVKLLSRYERSDSYIDKLLDHELSHAELNQPDKSLLTEIVNGTIRWRGRLDWILNGFYRGDYQKCLNIVKNSMRVALYQILFLNKIPVASAVDEAVEIVKRIQGEKTANIVNGVLRNIARNIPNIRYPDKEEDVVYYLSVIYSHPKWMVKRWLERYGEEFTEKLLFANTNRPYIPLRINSMKTDRDTVAEALNKMNIIYYTTPYFYDALLLKNPNQNIFSSELFQNGFATVQDPSAALAARLAQPQEGMTVIDLCAAPGGKSFYLAEMMHDKGTVIALEKYRSKLRFIEEGASRIGLNSIKTLTDDARTYMPENPADIVFADVPCSGLGTLSKKPDIKWKKDTEDVQKIAVLQREIMENAARTIKVGGIFIYSTCTIEYEENQENVEWFLGAHPEFELDPAENYLNKDVCLDGYYQVFPNIHEIDGAFAARFVKRS
ncbi:MAG: rRNA (cytosine967-C5)-methyltransferase [Bacteroidota bacterium]|nr:rRNA (cytosine967-C5)-methyltransferase [Bacteroidota bacterium]